MRRALASTLPQEILVRQQKIAYGLSILRKEDKTMKYVKPKIAVLGEAITVIEMTGKPGPSSEAPTPGTINTAYDLDE
jgi:hypothetical protein